MSTVPDGLFEYGGVPVRSGRYEGMWGGRSFFVDYDNGRSGGTGFSPADAGMYLDDALSAATAWDTIYVRGRTTYDTGGDPYYVLPKSTANWATGIAQQGLSIIGTPVGRPNIASLHGTVYLRGSATVQATPALEIRSPFVNVENICLRRGGSTVGALRFMVSATPYYGFNGTVSNCLFQKCTSYPALIMSDSWYTSAFNTTFQSCYQGILLAAPTASIQNTQIIGCVFQGLATEIDCDIYANISGANLVNIVIDRCIMDHAQPSGGSQNKYIKLDSTTNTGIWSNSNLGTLTTTVATAATLGGLPYSHIYIGGNNLTLTTA
jgi:hypothetical protein